MKITGTVFDSLPIFHLSDCGLEGMERMLIVGGLGKRVNVALTNVKPRLPPVHLTEVHSHPPLHPCQSMWTEGGVCQSVKELAVGRHAAGTAMPICDSQERKLIVSGGLGGRGDDPHISSDCLLFTLDRASLMVPPFLAPFRPLVQPTKPTLRAAAE